MRLTNFKHNVGRPISAAVCGVGLLALIFGAPAFAQYPATASPYPEQQGAYQQQTPYPQQQAPTPWQTAPPNYQQQQTQAQQPLMPPQQLDDVVAPIALYPDPLLGQVLAASTYPLEVVEAQQWMQQNSNLRGQDLMNAARQQNWDPSVQALVVFPDALAMLSRDVQWTTALGNAFLAQQQDVMAAVQRMRVRAQANGRLNSNAQETVNTQTDNGQNAVVIEPANPDYVSVPQYNPEYVWGPPAWGYYPPLYYPPVSYGFGFGPGIYLGGILPRLGHRLRRVGTWLGLGSWLGRWRPFPERRFLQPLGFPSMVRFALRRRLRSWASRVGARSFPSRRRRLFEWSCGGALRRNTALPGGTK